MRIFLDTTVILAACGRTTGASRAIFDRSIANGWRLLTSRYVLTEVARNIPKLPPQALVDWPALSTKLTITRDVWTMDRPVVFGPTKDRPVLFTAAAWSQVLLTLDSGDFSGLFEKGFYHLRITKPSHFLESERAAGRLQ